MAIRWLKARDAPYLVGIIVAAAGWTAQSIFRNYTDNEALFFRTSQESARSGTGATWFVAVHNRSKTHIITDLRVIVSIARACPGLKIDAQASSCRTDPDGPYAADKRLELAPDVSLSGTYHCDIDVLMPGEKTALRVTAVGSAASASCLAVQFRPFSGLRQLPTASTELRGKESLRILRESCLREFVAEWIDWILLGALGVGILLIVCARAWDPHD